MFKLVSLVFFLLKNTFNCITDESNPLAVETASLKSSPIVADVDSNNRPSKVHVVDGKTYRTPSRRRVADKLDDPLCLNPVRDVTCRCGDTVVVVDVTSLCALHFLFDLHRV